MVRRLPLTALALVIIVTMGLLGPAPSIALEAHAPDGAREVQVAAVGAFSWLHEEPAALNSSYERLVDRGTKRFAGAFLLLAIILMAAVAAAADSASLFRLSREHRPSSVRLAVPASPRAPPVFSR